jgi:hypothetical protein
MDTPLSRDDQRLTTLLETGDWLNIQVGRTTALYTPQALHTACSAGLEVYDKTSWSMSADTHVQPRSSPGSLHFQSPTQTLANFGTR